MPTDQLTPLRFAPVYKSAIWGGSRIAPFKSVEIDRDDVGESWEISAIPGSETPVSEGPLAGMTLNALIGKFGERIIGRRLFNRGVKEFPLLVKFIDAKSDLSVQVHPGDEIARYRHNCPGKTEMWYIIDASPKSTIISGFSSQITRDEYRQKVSDGTILDSVAIHPTHPGDTFFIPSGRVHAIGAGNLLLEIQQSSDITYRIFDYCRGRELHTDQAAEAIDYRVYDDYTLKPKRVRKGVDVLVQCPVFEVNLLTIDGSMNVDRPDESFLTMTCVGGDVMVGTSVGDYRLSQGETLLVPAEITDGLTVTGKGSVITASC